jgi:hypothetical protein
MTAPVEKIVFGQQDLRDSEAELLKGIVVHAHQPALAHGGAGLHESEVGGTRGKFQALYPESDGPRRNEQNFAAGAAEIGEGLRNAVKGPDGDSAVIAHQHVGADFDHDAGGSGNLFAGREFSPLGFGGSYGFSPRDADSLYANPGARSHNSTLWRCA